MDGLLDVGLWDLRLWTVGCFDGGIQSITYKRTRVKPHFLKGLAKVGFSDWGDAITKIEIPDPFQILPELQKPRFFHGH